MRRLRAVIALFVTAALGVSISPQTAAGQPTTDALITVPAVQQWEPGGTPNFQFHGREIHVAPGNDELAQVARTLAEDIEARTGTAPRVVVSDRQQPGAILLQLGDQGHGPESYSLEIGRSLVITGTTPHGAFNGTRTVLQLLDQGPRIPAGRVLDWPGYEVRSVLVDQTPRHFSMDWWNNFFRHMSYVKLNDTNLYLDGVGLDLDEMRAIDELASKYYVKVVPQINMPSHMAVLLPSQPQYQLENPDGTRDPQALDLTNPEAWEWTFSLIDDYIDIFSSDEWHLGTDEFPGWPGTGENHPHLDAYAKEQFGPEATFADLFAAYQNAAAEHVRSHGKHPRVWNDMIRESAVVQLDTDVTVEYWIQHPDLPGLLSAPDLAERGYPLINAHIDWLYYDQSRRNLDPREVYEVFEVTNFPFRDDVPREAVRGARMPAWLAWIYTPMESDAEVLNNLVPSMYALAQKTWDSPQLVETWNEFRDVIDTVGEAPGLRAESENTIQPNPATARNADETVAYFARDLDGNLWTGKQAAPGLTHYSQTLIGHNVAGDPVVTTLDDGRLQVVARTANDRLLVATQEAPNSEDFTSTVLDVRVDADPALVPGTAVVNNNGRLESVDLDSGQTTRITQNAEGSPSAVLQDGAVHVASRTKHGSVYSVMVDGAWEVLEDRSRRLASDPEVVVTGGQPQVIAVDQSGSLTSASPAQGGWTWTDIVGDAVGQQDTAVGPNGLPQTAVRTGSRDLVHAWYDGSAWHHAVMVGDVVTDPTITINHLDEPFVYAQTGRETQLVAQKAGDAYYNNHLAESTLGLTAATFDNQGWPIYFVATNYGDLQTGTKWGNLWQWGRDFAIGTMSFPDDELTPDQFTNVLLHDTFDTDTSDRYTTLKLSDWEVAPDPVIGNGEMSVSASEPFFSTMVSDVPVAAGDTVVITEVTQQLAEAIDQNTVFVGFVRDVDNYSMMWSASTGHRIGFDTRTEGRMTPDGGYGNVPVVVREGDRLATVLTGNWMVGYVERHGVWHRVHTAVANGLDNLRDPEVRAQYRYAVGIRGDAGTISLGELIAAER